MPYCSSSSNLYLHKDQQEQIEVQALQFNVHLNIDALPGFEDTSLHIGMTWLTAFIILSDLQLFYLKISTLFQ